METKETLVKERTEHVPYAAIISLHLIQPRSRGSLLLGGRVGDDPGNEGGPHSPIGSFSLICLDATKFVFFNVFTLIQMICPKIWSKSHLKIAKSPLPVDLRRSKTSLRKLRTWANSWLPWTLNTIITGLTATVFVKFYAFLTEYLFQNRISLITDKNCGK